MKLSVRALAFLILLGSSSAALAEDPVFQLRNSFIMGYVNQAEKHGESIDKAAQEAGCMYDIMAKSMTVQEYVEQAKAAKAGGRPTPVMIKLIPQIKRECLGAN